MVRHWSINGRFLSQPATGVQRYAREIVAGLDQLIGAGHPLAAGLEIEILTPPDDRGRDIGSGPSLAHIGVRKAGSGSGHAWEQMSLALQTRGGLLSLCNTGPVMAQRHIVCIHDANTRTRPASYSLAFRTLYRGLLPLLGRRAHTITTVSHYAAGQLARVGIAARDKIIVAGNGFEHAKAWQARHTPATREASGPKTVVVIGSLAQHKNIARVLDLAPRLGAAGFTLAVVGQADARVFNALSTPAASKQVRMLGRLDDGALAALLDDSLCLAFPSLDEGFGLPPLEAFARGCPVIASTSASLPEVCGGAALYASPYDSEAWLQAILRLGAESELRRALSAAGLTRAPRFSWRRSAGIYLTAMARADGLDIPAAALDAAA